MKMDGRRKIIVAVTGASGSVYARLLCEALSRVAELGEIALIVTGNGCRVAAFEDGDEWLSDSRFTRYDDDDLFAAPASRFGFVRCDGGDSLFDGYGRTDRFGRFG